MCLGRYFAIFYDFFSYCYIVSRRIRMQKMRTCETACPHVELLSARVSWCFENEQIEKQLIA